MAEEENREILPLPSQSTWETIHQIFYQGQNYYRIVDVIGALGVAQDPADYWSVMKRRVRSEGFAETRAGIVQFEVKTPKDKRLHKHDYATRVVLLRLIQSIPSPRVEDLKIWLAETGEQRMQASKIDRVEAELEAIREYYRKIGRDERWIRDRIQNIKGYTALTEQWIQRGAVEHLDFARLSSILHKGALGVTPGEHQDIKQLAAEINLRDHMDQVELALLTLAEAVSTAKHVENDTQGVLMLEQDVHETAQASSEIRKLTEKNLGRPVVSPGNFLPQQQNQQLPPNEEKG